MSHHILADKKNLKLGSDKQSISYIFWGICSVMAVIGLMTANPVETFCGCLIWPILFLLLWRPGEPPVLLFAAAFQSIQVLTPVIVADLSGKTLQQVLGDELSMAFYLGSLAILVLAYGMKLGMGKIALSNFIDLEGNESQTLRVDRLAIAYLGTLAFSTVISSIAFSESGLTQFLLAIDSFHWFVVFLIIWAGFRHSQFRLLAISVTLVEILVGLTGFFSGFKTVLFVILIIYGGTSTRVSRLLRPQALILLTLILILTTYWQGIKGDYRSYVNAGTSTQSIQVSFSDRLAFHGLALSKINTEELNVGFESGLDRLGYLNFFAGSIKTVPSVIPHQEGRLWSEAIVHTLTPRFIFPNKPTIDDSQRTNTFTGFRVAGAAQGTSVSIGYVGESYIDFGVPMMFVPILALGYFWGWLYRSLANFGKVPLLGLAAATTILLNVSITFESSNIKIVGGAVSAFLVYLVFLYFGGGIVWQWLTGKSQKANQKLN